MKPFPCQFMTDRGNFINYADRQIQLMSAFVDIPVPPVRPVAEVIGYEVLQLSTFIDAEQEAELMRLLTDCISSRWHPDFTDINAKNCSKATGMDVFMQHFGVGKEQTIAFGDGANDIPMLQHAAVGIAMGNASDSVKQAADYVTDSVDHNGIANALRHFRLLP
jgi:Cof subfamily protein (haloacid dehalogenase superfamily)